MTRPDDLPEFAQPPVTEVVLAIQFADLADFRITDVGPLWERFKDAFPRVTEQPVLAPEFEIFGGVTAEVGPHLRLTMGPSLQRVWFESAAQTEILQFQRNRFIYNWRKPDREIVYPRFDAIKSAFFGHVKTLQDYLEERGLPKLALNQCEVTYINIIPLSRDERDASRRVFKVWSQNQYPELGEQEDASFGFRFVYTEPGQGEGAEPFARLTASSVKGLDRDGTPVIQFNLMFRGRPLPDGLAGADRFFEFGRDKIVRGFTALTTDAMHAAWERQK